MPHAFLNPDGTIREVVPKLRPYMKVGVGERIVAYDPPQHDPEVEDVTPDTPVPAQAHAVTFTVTPKPLVETADIWVERKTDVIQGHLDAAAQQSGYDGILSAASYATSNNPVFGPEGRSFMQWRDACWTTGIQILTDVQAGLRAMPSDEQLIAELPARVA